MSVISQEYSFIWYGFCPNTGGVTQSCENLELTNSLGIKTAWQIDGSSNAKAWVSGASAGQQSFTHLKCGSVYYIEKSSGASQINIPHAFLSPYDSGSANRLSTACSPFTPTSTETILPTPTSSPTSSATSSATSTNTSSSSPTTTQTEQASGGNPSALGYIIAQVHHSGTDQIANELFNDANLDLNSLSIDAGNTESTILSGRTLKYAGNSAADLADYITKFTAFANSSTVIGSNDPLGCNLTGFGDFQGNKHSPCLVTEIPLGSFNADGSFNEVTFNQGIIVNSAASKDACDFLENFATANACTALPSKKIISNIPNSSTKVAVLYSIWLPVDQVSSNEYSFNIRNANTSFGTSGTKTIDATPSIYNLDVSFNGTTYKCYTATSAISNAGSSVDDSNDWSVTDAELDASDKVLHFSSTLKS